MNTPICPNVTAFLVRLRKIDTAELKARDVLVLYAIMANPGASGMEITTKLGIKERSLIASNLARLERAGFIEDRRDKKMKAVPGMLYALPAGVQFWEEIKP